MEQHTSECRWERSNCEWKETHYYCPHPEHECDCEGLPVYKAIRVERPSQLQDVYYIYDNDDASTLRIATVYLSPTEEVFALEHSKFILTTAAVVELGGLMQTLEAQRVRKGATNEND